MAAGWLHAQGAPLLTCTPEAVEMPRGVSSPAVKTQLLLEEMVCWSEVGVSDYATLRASRAR